MKKNLTLILHDNDEELSIKLDQNDIFKICNSSNFFKTMLTNFKEQYMDKISILVPNASISENIILSMCDRQNETPFSVSPFWNYILQTITCQIFLCIDPHIHLLKDLKIPIEGFKLLLDVIYSIGYDQNTIPLLDNIPEDYDLHNLDKNLIEKIIEFNEQYKYKIISGHNHGYIKIWDLEFGTVINTIDTQTDKIFYCCFFPDNNSILSYGEYNSVQIWDTKTGKLVSNLNDNLGTQTFIYSVCLSPNGKIVVVVYEHRIDFYDVSKHNMVNAVHCLVGTINEVVVTVLKKDYSLRDNYLIQDHQSCISPDSKFLAVTSNVDRTVKIYNIKKLVLVNVLVGRFDDIENINFSGDGQAVLFGDKYDAIIIWDFCENSVYKINSEYWDMHCVHYCDDFVISIEDDGEIKKHDSFNRVTILQFGANFEHNFTTIGKWSSCFLRDKQLLVVGSSNINNYIEVLDLVNDKLFRTLSDKNFDDKNGIMYISSSYTFFPKFDSLVEKIKMMGNKV